MSAAMSVIHCHAVLFREGIVCKVHLALSLSLFQPDQKQGAQLSPP